jgi:O-antigen/teichoic acid export membrane protein
LPRGYSAHVETRPSAERQWTTGRREVLRELARSDTGRAAGMGVAVIATNVLALVFTVIFARMLGASGYGSLAVLISAFIILMVPGSALQIAAAREVSRDLANGAPNAGAGVRRWLRRLVIATVAIALVSIPLRSVIGAVVNVDELWGAAAIPVTSMLWAILSLERGVLQGFQRYRIVAASLVGEATTRILFALLLVSAGADVTGAFLGSALSLIAMALALLVPLRGHLVAPAQGPEREVRLRDLLAGAWVPVLGLTLLLALQEIHVIIIKHEASEELAGSYAVAAVAAKAIIWVAVGLGLYLLPEATRRGETGEDARPILLRTLGLIAAAGAPMVLIYSVAGEPLLAAAFGDDLTEASNALPWLGLAMSLLASTYLSVQYLLALGRASFIGVLAVGVVAEVVALVVIGADLTSVALALVAIQAVCAGTVLTLAFRRAGTGARFPVPA